MIEYLQRRLAALRAEKKRRLQLEHDVGRCEACSRIVDLADTSTYCSAGDEGGVLCRGCEYALAETDDNTDPIRQRMQLGAAAAEGRTVQLWQDGVRIVEVRPATADRPKALLVRLPGDER